MANVKYKNLPLSNLKKLIGGGSFCLRRLPSSMIFVKSKSFSINIKKTDFFCKRVSLQENVLRVADSYNKAESYTG